MSKYVKCDDFSRVVYPVEAVEVDEWHPASEPPKPEDFEPTWNIDIGWFVEGERPRATEVGKHSIGLYKDWTHWRKITPPK